MAPGVASLKCRAISVPGLAAVLKFVALHHDLEHVGFHRGLFLPRRITRHTPRARIGAKKTKPQTNCERRKKPANLNRFGSIFLTLRLVVSAPGLFPASRIPRSPKAKPSRRLGRY